MRPLQGVGFGNGAVKISTLLSGIIFALVVAFNPLNAGAAPGDLYVTTGFNPGSIVRITPDGTKNTFTTNLNGPWGVAFDSSGNLFETDNNGGIIYKFTPDGSRTTVGSLANVTGLAVDTSGNVYAAASYCFCRRPGSRLAESRLTLRRRAAG